MGKKDDAIVPFFKDKVHFADLFNGSLFDGEQLILPTELEIMDSVNTELINDKDKKTYSIKRFRDIVMKWNNKITLAILACEVQENVHHAMPVRNMLYDSLSYTNQIKELWGKLSEQEKRQSSRSEFLSHFRKDDFIYPVITIVFYYGDDWDGNLDLHSMFNINDQTWVNKKILKKYIPNYHINLINPAKIEDLSVFKSDLQLIFGMLKYKDDKEKLFNFTKDNSSYFKSVCPQTAHAIGTFLNADRLLDKILEKDEKEDTNMCKALDDLYNDGVEKGRLEGIRGTVMTLRSINWTNEAIIDKLIEIHKLNSDEAKDIISTTI